MKKETHVIIGNVYSSKMSDRMLWYENEKSAEFVADSKEGKWPIEEYF